VRHASIASGRGLSQIAIGAQAKGDTTVTQGFQQQDAFLNFSFPKSAPTPQHGQKPDPKKAAPVRPQRTFEPRPGH
jgi:hypothetical protein